MDRKIIKKVVMLGTPCVGKSTLIEKYVHNAFDDKYIKTIGVKTVLKDSNFRKGGEDYNVRMVLWDTNGRYIIDPNYINMYSMHLKGTQGLVVVYDSTNKKSYDNLVKSLRFAKVTLGEKPTIFLANKIDLAEREEFQERVISKIASEWDADYFLTSAKTGRGVNRAFEKLAKSLIV